MDYPPPPQGEYQGQPVFTEQPGMGPGYPGPPPSDKDGVCCEMCKCCECCCACCVCWSWLTCCCCEEAL
ncbi:unnamed protein product [Caenorhabditis angaria]|uniref:Uncharacterized protein n=1 Tax=Caenorhabditis angaria TaxID=860376 RepID=A0A9P1INK7_9PELO|nr:unnamed protein product [Caenorhabditis angaria]